jgi:hypothetical protein
VVATGGNERQIGGTANPCDYVVAEPPFLQGWSFMRTASRRERLPPPTTTGPGVQVVSSTGPAPIACAGKIVTAQGVVTATCRLRPDLLTIERSVPLPESWRVSAGLARGNECRSVPGCLTSVCHRASANAAAGPPSKGDDWPCKRCRRTSSVRRLASGRSASSPSLRVNARPPPRWRCCPG